MLSLYYCSASILKGRMILLSCFGVSVRDFEENSPTPSHTLKTKLCVQWHFFRFMLF